MGANLLLIEDDECLAELIQECLECEGFTVHHAITGSKALQKCRDNKYDLIICDLMLPDTNGFELVKKLDSNSLSPFIFLTAICDDNTHIRGLESGAADFIAKPVDPSVLIARVKSSLRQYSVKTDIITVNSYTFYARNKSLKRGQAEVAITNQEFDILWEFINKPESPLSREYLFEQIIGRPYDGIDRAADLIISRLRKKLSSLGCVEINISTIRGKGYMLTIDESA